MKLNERFYRAVSNVSSQKNIAETVITTSAGKEGITIFILGCSNKMLTYFILLKRTQLTTFNILR